MIYTFLVVIACVARASYAVSTSTGFPNEHIPSADDLQTIDHFPNWKLVLLTQAAEQQGARCLDGTAPGYYIERGSGTGVGKWMIHWQGGGWCTSEADCVGRSHGDLGSSKNYNSTADKNHILPVNILQNTFSDRARCIAQLRPASSFPLSGSAVS